MGPVVIVLFDPTGDAGSRFFEAAIFRRPDCLFLHAAIKRFDVVFGLLVMTRSTRILGAAAQSLGTPRR